MKRKPQSPPADLGAAGIVSSEILENAKRSVLNEGHKATAKCVVCSAEATPTAGEQLCWVCRRLKISAWRDADNQLSNQE